MGRKEWSLARAQMAFWQGFLRSKTEMIPYLSFPQRILLDHFSRGADNEPVKLLKDAESIQVKIEKRKERAHDFLTGKEIKENEKKLEALKERRETIFSALEAVENERSQKLLDLAKLDTVWPIVAYETMLGAAPLLPEQYSPQFLLNICFDEPADGLASAMQRLPSALALQRDGALAEESGYSRGRSGPILRAGGTVPLFFQRLSPHDPKTLRLRVTAGFINVDSPQTS